MLVFREYLISPLVSFYLTKIGNFPPRWLSMVSFYLPHLKQDNDKHRITNLLKELRVSTFLVLAPGVSPSVDMSREHWPHCFLSCKYVKFTLLLEHLWMLVFTSLTFLSFVLCQTSHLRISNRFTACGAQTGGNMNKSPHSNEIPIFCFMVHDTAALRPSTGSVYLYLLCPSRLSRSSLRWLEPLVLAAAAAQLLLALMNRPQPDIYCWGSGFRPHSMMSACDGAQGGTFWWRSEDGLSPSSGYIQLQTVHFHS